MNIQNFVRFTIVFFILLPVSAWAKLRIEGVDGDLKDDLEKRLNSIDIKCSAEEWRMVRQRDSFTDKAQISLKAFGYYAAEVDTQLAREDDCWTLTLKIERGERITLRKIHVEADHDKESLPDELSKLIKRPPFREGDALYQPDYDRYKSSLMDAAGRLGFFRAEYRRAELAIFPETRHADVDLELILGPRFTFGPYRISSTPLNDDLLDRLTLDLEGEPYSSERLTEAYKDFQRSNYFAQVLISPVIDTEDDSLVVPLDVDLGMASRHSAGAGIGFSTDLGPRVTAEYENRFVNSEGHKFRSEAQWSVKNRSISGTYIIPRERAAREWYELGGGYTEEETDTYDTVTRTGLARIVSVYKRWVFNTGVNIQNERYIIADDPIEQSNLVIPSVGANWVYADDRVRQRYGLSFETKLSFSNEMWLSDTDFMQAYARTKGLWSLTERARFLSRVELAGTIIDDLELLPPSVRFFTGGDNSVRGYAYNSIGSTNEEGEVIGGSKLFSSSVELDYLLYKSWSASVFFDQGDAFDEDPEFMRAWGFGVRWYSPVGPVRVDFAFPEEGKDSIRLHLSVGAEI